MLTVNNREEILPWLDHVLIGSPYGPFGDGGVGGNISTFGMIGDQNVVIGKIRIQQSHPTRLVQNASNFGISVEFKCLLRQTYPVGERHRCVWSWDL